jgi:hypothetical protein
MSGRFSDLGLEGNAEGFRFEARLTARPTLVAVSQIW